MPPFKGLKNLPLTSAPMEEPEVSSEALSELPAAEAKEETLEEPSGDLLDQGQVLYREGESCGDCEYFVAEGEACSKVQGPISSNGWCVIFRPGASGISEEIPNA